MSIATSPRLAGSAARWQLALLALTALGFVLRLAYIGRVELLPEETYYWNYAQHLDLGYLDHPPMVAWLIRLGTLLCGDTELGVRSGALGCAIIAAGFNYGLTRNLFGPQSAAFAPALLQVLPFFFLAGMIMTPDAPLTAAWSASLYFLERALLAGRSRAWLLAGVSLGVGLISKYTISLLVPATWLFVVLDRPSRHWLRRWEPFAALALALLIFSPVILWNAQHEWASFAFQTSRRLAEAPRFALHRLLLSALVLLTPAGLITVLMSRLVRPGTATDDTVLTSRPVHPSAATDDTMSMSRPVRAGAATGGARMARRWLFLRLAVLVPLAVFVVFSVRHDVKIDWTGALWLAAVPALAVSILTAEQSGHRRWLLRTWQITAVTLVVLYGAGLHYLVSGLPGVPYSTHTELIPVGWRDLGRQINDLADAIRKDTGMEPVIVGMDRYELASQLTFYAPDHARSVPETTSRNLFGEQGLMYQRWFSPGQVADRTLLLVAWDPHDLSDELTRDHVSELSPIHEGAVTRGGVVVRRYYYRFARGFRPQTAQ